MANTKHKEHMSSTKEDIEKNKTMAIVAWIIFFIPLLTEAKNSKFVRFHVNQSLLVVLTHVAVYFLILILLATPLAFIALLLYLFPFVLWVMGIVSAVNGEMKKLPVIGDIELIK